MAPEGTEDKTVETTTTSTRRRREKADPSALPRGFEDPAPDQKKYDGGDIPKSSKK